MDCLGHEKGMTEDEMAGWHHWLDRHESEWTPRVGDGQGGLEYCNFGGRKESDTTEPLNWTELRLCSPRNSPGQNTGVGSLSLLKGIFPTQRSNPDFPHHRQILYQLSHKGSPRILEWIAYPFSNRSSRPRNGTEVSCIAGRFFTNWNIREYIYI